MPKHSCLMFDECLSEGTIVQGETVYLRVLDPKDYRHITEALQKKIGGRPHGPPMRVLLRCPFCGTQFPAPPRPSNL